MKPPRGARLRRAAAGLILTCAAAAAHAADTDENEPSVTPYRPTVSNPADLPVPGWLELEAGGSWLHDADGTHTASVPYLLKYAFDSDHGILVGGNAWADRHAPGAAGTHGVGDTLVEWKQRFPLRDGMAFGIEAGVEIPSAPDALGIGKPAYLVNGIYSVDLGATHLDLNAGGTRYTRAFARGSAWQSAWAAALSHPLGGDFGVAGEISGTAQRGVGHSHQALAAFNYNVSKRCVLDAGIAQGLDRSDRSHDIFFGGTWLLGKVR